MTDFNNNLNWVFAFMSNDYEEGLPHTRGNIIFISPIIIEYDKNQLIKTLIHESIHIYQRYNKEIIDNYLKSNGFIAIKNRNSEKLIRSNPDLDEFIYNH